jgi:hypothetical protein
MKKKILKLVDSQKISTNVRIFNSRFVDEIKNADTKKAFEKSRLIVQTYNDLNKNLMLTSSLTIQRVSQRLIVCLAIILQNQKQNINLYLRNITQIYVQSTFELNRDFYIRSSLELITLLDVSNDCILKMMKSLYDVLETENHWFATYHRHHLQLEMIELTNDSCLLYKFSSLDYSLESLEIVDMQIDDILILTDSIFVANEEKTIKRIKILIKNRDQLTTKSSIKFNDIKIELESNKIISLVQKSHVDDISLIINENASSISFRDIIRAELFSKEQYVAQRTREAYIASIYQLETSFDLSHATQSIEFSSDDIILLNKRLQWQLNNKIKELNYVKLDRNSLQQMIFIDSSFVNNRDVSSRIEYVICLVDLINQVNIIHWSFIKYKRVTRSVLIVELYEMTHSFDIEIVIKRTLRRIFEINISLILCIDSKSLYDCLVRLRTTQKKRLMINVMSLRLSYERREIIEIT